MFGPADRRVEGQCNGLLRENMKLYFPIPFELRDFRCELLTPLHHRQNPTYTSRSTSTRYSIALCHYIFTITPELVSPESLSSPAAPHPLPTPLFSLQTMHMLTTQWWKGKGVKYTTEGAVVTYIRHMRRRLPVEL